MSSSKVAFIARHTFFPSDEVPSSKTKNEKIKNSNTIKKL